MAACGARATAAAGNRDAARRQHRAGQAACIHTSAERKRLVEGHNVELDFRWGPWEQSPALAVELIRRRVTVIRTGS